MPFAKGCVFQPLKYGGETIEKRKIHDVDGLSDRLREITNRAAIDLRFLHEDHSRELIVERTRDAASILDVGASMRDHLGSLTGEVETLDINDFGFQQSLKPGGTLFLYVPWMWRYHGPKNLLFQDYQRLSRDGMAYLLRDFEDVTLYPLRGKYAARMNFMKLWKRKVEKHFGGRFNRMLDSRVSDWRNTVQASGYFAEARKPL